MKKTTLLSCIFLVLGWTSTAFAFGQSLKPFDEIILSGNVSALLVEGAAENIEIKNDEDRLEVYVEGKVLKIKARDLMKYHKTPTIKVIITYKKIRSLKARAGASAYTNNPLKGDKLELKFSTGAFGEIELYQNALEVSVTEGGALKLEGEAAWQEAKVSTGGTISAYKLDCKNTIIKANTGGSAKVMAYESIEASANTGGSIAYKGNPQKVRTKDGFSGSIKEW